MLYKSQFKKNYTWDWFCGPGSHIFKKNVTYFYTTVYDLMIKE